MSKLKQSAFTLIELLVVIAIIGILSTLAIIALGNARAKARDAKRVADIKQISTALELYYADNGNYPTIITPGNSLVSPDGTKTYMAVIPSNPTPRNDSGCGDNNYTYAATSDNTNYSLNYCISNPTGSTPAGINSSSSSGAGTAPGLVGWWKFDEGTGTAAADSAGTNNCIKIGTGTTYYSTGKLGPYSRNFEGANYVSCGDASSVNFGTGSFSIVFWEKTTNTSQKNFIQKSNNGWGAGEIGFIVLKTGGGIYINLGDGTNWFHDLFYANYSSGNYEHMVIVYDKSQSRSQLYFNGSPVTISSHSGNDLSSVGNVNYAIGLAIGGSSSPWLGELDDVRIYNRALSAAEILALYNATK